MKFDVAELIERAGRTRQATVTLPAIHPTSAQAQDLQRIYMRVVRAWGAEAQERIMPVYARTLSELVRDTPDEVQGAMDKAAGEVSRLVVALGPELEDWIVRIETWHRGRFGQAFTASGVKLDTLLGVGDVAPTLQSVLNENTALIRSLDDQMRNGISGAVFRGLAARTPAADVAKEIRQLASVGRSRAELIASDQLQKLTGRLDQERQEQVGIKKFEWVHSRKAKPRPEHVARNGKIYAWDSALAKTDPPGRAIRCGCRARGVVELDADEAATPAPPPPPPPPPAGFTSPRREGVTAETIKVQPRLATQKALRADLAKAAEHPAYTQVAGDRWGDRGPKDHGNAVFSAAFDDEAVSMIAALKPEIDDLARQIGIPPIRGFKSISGDKHIANMGDGVFAINPKYFNGYASRVGGRSETGALDAVKAQRADVQAELAPVVDRLKTVKAEMTAARFTDMPLSERTRNAEFLALYDEQDALYKKYNALRVQDEKLWKKESGLKRGAGEGEATTWKPGDDPKKRPFNADLYFADGVDRARSTFYHEFGHHVHQYLNRRGPRRLEGPPPLEAELAGHYRKAMATRKLTQASTYATADQYEWFAENFSLFVSGRKDLVDEGALELIERIFRREY